MLDVVKQHKGIVGLVVANGGVAVSLLFGAFQFVSTYEQTQADVAFLHSEFDQMVRQDQMDALSFRLADEIQQASSQLDFAGEESSRIAERVTVLETQRDETRNREHLLDDISNRLSMIDVAIAALETRVERSDEDRWKLDDMDSRLDRLDDFVVRWDEQSSSIMVEHLSFGEIIDDLYARLDELTGDRTRVTIPAGAKREYGY